MEGRKRVRKEDGKGMGKGGKEKGREKGKVTVPALMFSPSSLVTTVCYLGISMNA